MTKMPTLAKFGRNFATQKKHPFESKSLGTGFRAMERITNNGESSCVKTPKRKMIGLIFVGVERKA
jgi:hypothetical protein